jgi:hypothetical protein
VCTYELKKKKRSHGNKNPCSQTENTVEGISSRLQVEDRISEFKDKIEIKEKKT